MCLVCFVCVFVILLLIKCIGLFDLTGLFIIAGDHGSVCLGFKLEGCVVPGSCLLSWVIALVCVFLLGRP